MRLRNLLVSNAIEMISSLIVKIKLRDGGECFVTWEAPREAAGLKKARHQPSFYQLRIITRSKLVMRRGEPDGALVLDDKLRGWQGSS